MRPIPQTILIIFLVALCGLCIVQWQRESDLRKIATTQRDEIIGFEIEKQDADARIKAADAEILRLTGSLNELRTTSVSKQEFEDQAKLQEEMKAAFEKQNEIIKQQNEAVVKQNASIAQMNESVKKLIGERDSLATRLNDVTSKYNKLANPAGAGANASTNAAAAGAASN